MILPSASAIELSEARSPAPATSAATNLAICSSRCVPIFRGPADGRQVIAGPRLSRSFNSILKKNSDPNPQLRQDEIRASALLRRNNTWCDNKRSIEAPD
jgi:hypothetical protein